MSGWAPSLALTDQPSLLSERHTPLNACNDSNSAQGSTMLWKVSPAHQVPCLAATCCKAVTMHVQLLDVFRCVERLSDTDASSFRRLVQRDSLVAAVPRTDSLPAFKVDTRELLRRLPLHIMACVLAQEPRENGRRSQGNFTCGTRI